MSANIGLLRKGLDALGLDGGENRLERLARYTDEIELWNPAYGLVKASGDELIVKHVLDSLSVLPLICELALPVSHVADLGTGAGLPGIPLSLFLPDSRMTLVERMEKRVRFLENQKALLGLSNVEIVQADVERAKGPFDLVTFRAFRPFSEIKLFRAVLRLMAPGGVILAYKGKRSRAQEELSELAAAPGLEAVTTKARVFPVSVPFLEEERCAVVLRT